MIWIKNKDTGVWLTGSLLVYFTPKLIQFIFLNILKLKFENIKVNNVFDF